MNGDGGGRMGMVEDEWGWWKMNRGGLQLFYTACLRLS